MTTVEIRGAELVSARWGIGPDLVWGHGLTSSMASEDELGLFDWNHIADAATVLRYDARGHGTSSSTPDLDGYHWRELALDQLALTERLGIDRYVAAGASMGCATALHAAVLVPERIRGLVLVIPPTAWATRAAQAATYTLTADLVERGDHDTLLAGASMTPSPDPFVGDPAWESRFGDLLATVDPVRLARLFRGAAAADLPSEADIAAIGVPTLILAWTGDPGHPASTAGRLQELIGGSELALAATKRGLATWSSRIARFMAELGE